MTVSILAPIVAVVALAVSLFTLWFTILRRGTIRSTHPAFIAVRYDFVSKTVPQAKIFLRALLFSTGKRGRVVESLFLRVRDEEHQTEFSFWGMGDKDLIRGAACLFPKRASPQIIISIRSMPTSCSCSSPASIPSNWWPS